MIDFDDDTMDGEFALMKEIAKQNHDERVAKTPDRIEYAIKRFTDEGIKYKILNHQIGHFHIWDEQSNLFQFWASTGKIYYDKKTKDARNLKPLNDSYRGIENCIKLVKQKKEKSKIELLQDVKVELRKQVVEMQDDNHCYLQKCVHWQDIVAIIDRKISELGGKNEKQ